MKSRVRLTWTDNARRGLREIEAFLGERADPSDVDAVIEGIFAATDQVEKFPFIAPPWPLASNESFRRLSAGDYVVIYFVDVEVGEARVLSVRHTLQRPAALRDVKGDPGR